MLKFNSLQFDVTTQFAKFNFLLRETIKFFHDIEYQMVYIKQVLLSIVTTQYSILELKQSQLTS